MRQSKIIKREWYVVDATDKVLGRLSSKVAMYLIGKHKIEYAPYFDVGDYIIIINSKKIYVSGRKYENKIYYRHTGYVGGIKSLKFKELISINSNKVIENSVKGMLPKNKLGRVMFRRLKVYTSTVHNHEAQSPKFLQIS
ncbi:50S ribosomal protein L13 [Candidatus Blochmanniella vafra str. BVAF]|uniref:Large ribosomal subunit protein uL13 n=2 Tax=Candidatus Blochmanniella vafra TaxID=251535 RepID=E8Q6M1_BLOVB|nr:50S ribosomal protein L13 [Candidatus Blochmannia vafer]ADV33462.1 50S ribosomal protein L13 [Candidatus Blochmannia vafer str. BVAF]